MMSENYRDFKQAYRPYGIFYNAVSMIVYYTVKDDKYEIGKPYAVRKDESVFRMWLQMGVNHKFVNDEMRCTHKDSIGTNQTIIQSVCKEIDDEMLHIPADNKELFIKDILANFSTTYKFIEPIFKNKRRYAKVYDMLTDDDDHSEKQSYEFVGWAYQNYQFFVEFLYSLCDKHNIDLDSLQDDNDLRITPYRSSRPKSATITKKKTATLSSDERAKKIERIRQYLANSVFAAATIRKYPELVEDVVIYAVDRCKSGKDIYALATFLYKCKNIAIASKPKTMTKWISMFKGACENDLPTDNWKPNKVKDEIKEVMKYFTYLQI